MQLLVMMQLSEAVERQFSRLGSSAISKIAVKHTVQASDESHSPDGRHRYSIDQLPGTTINYNLHPIRAGVSQCCV